MTEVLQSWAGVLVMPMFAYMLSESRPAHHHPGALRRIATGLALQFAIALALLKIPQSRHLFDWIGSGVLALQAATEEGMRLVFGYLAGAPAPFETTRPASAFLLGFRALPLILLMSVLARLLYYWGILQRLVSAVAVLFQRAFGIGGPLGTVAAAKLFLGMVEAPLLVRPYLATMGRGALFAAMAVGMATIAGTVSALYASILEPVLPGAAGHIVGASLMNAPAALMLARIVVPDGFEGGPATAELNIENPPRSSMDAIAQGASDGLRLLAAVIAMLVVMVSLVALANMALGAFTRPFGVTLTFQGILGWIVAPLAFLIGIPAGEAPLAGSLIGEKIILNELVAYLDLAAQPTGALSHRSRLILTYALCGFANLGSLGIMVGGLSTMVPERRADIVALAPRAMVVGLLATLLSGAVVGAIVWN